MELKCELCLERACVTMKSPFKKNPTVSSTSFTDPTSVGAQVRLFGFHLLGV